MDGGNADKTVKPVAHKTKSSMGTGTLVGIVAAIIGGVALLAFIAMGFARRRRDSEDDPLSPFDASIDKGYNPGSYMSNVRNGEPGGYGPNADRSGSMYSAQNADTMGSRAVPAGAAAAAAAGINYDHYYDQVSSPDSLYPPAPERADSYGTDEGANNDANLWMTAMDPSRTSSQDASVAPAANRSSYEMDPSVDIDQSSAVSGHNEHRAPATEYPDLQETSSRGSYEL